MREAPIHVGHHASLRSLASLPPALSLCSAAPASAAVNEPSANSSLLSALAMRSPLLALLCCLLCFLLPAASAAADSLQSVLVGDLPLREGPAASAPVVPPFDVDAGLSVSERVALLRSIASVPLKGWNSYDAYGGSVNESVVRFHIDYIAEHLLPFGYRVVCIDAGWYGLEGGLTMMDQWGRVQVDPVRYPSSVGMQGFKQLSAYAHSRGLLLGIHTMRGAHRQAIELKLPVQGTNYTIDQVHDPDGVCPWWADWFALNMSHPAAQAVYDAEYRLYAEWGLGQSSLPPHPPHRRHRPLCLALSAPPDAAATDAASLRADGAAGCAVSDFIKVPVGGRRPEAAALPGIGHPPTSHRASLVPRYSAAVLLRWTAPSLRTPSCWTCWPPPPPWSAAGGRCCCRYHQARAPPPSRSRWCSTASTCTGSRTTCGTSGVTCRTTSCPPFWRYTHTSANLQAGWDCRPTLTWTWFDTAQQRGAAQCTAALPHRLPDSHR